MKKLMTLIAATAISTSAFAAEITNINQSPRASVMTGLTVAVGEAITGDDQFYQSRDCADATNVYNDSDNVVMAYESMNVAAAKVKGIECRSNFKQEEVAVYTWAPFSICRLNETTTKLQDVSAFGMSGMHPYKKWSDEFNAKNNANLQVKLYGGSGATMKGLLAKEIEWGFIATAVAKKAANAKLVTCDYITDPNADNFVGNTFKHDLADLRIKVVILAKGEDAAQVKADLNTEEFKAYLTKYGYSHIQFDYDADSHAKYNREFDVLQSFYE